MIKRDYTHVTPEQFRKWLPMACTWALEQERFVLECGSPLLAHQSADAALAGVSQPEKVRLLPVEEIPAPAHRVLKEAAQWTGLITPERPALAVRYGIFVRSADWGRRRVLVHELARTAQYERLGGIRPFLECFLYECLVLGCPSAPMEQAAATVMRKVCGAESDPATGPPEREWPRLDPGDGIRPRGGPCNPKR